MKIPMLAAAFLAATSFGAAAQDLAKNNTSGQIGTGNEPSAIIAQLKPAQVKSPDQSGSTAWQYGLDVATTKALLPGVVGTETIWKTQGKNDQHGSNRPAVELEKLVPVLVGALQDQMLRITELEKEVKQLEAVAKAAGY